MTDILMRPIIAMQVAVHQLREREDGQTTTEYAILLGFLAIAIIVALFFLGTCCAASSRTRPAASRTRRTRTKARMRTARHGGPFAVHGLAAPPNEGSEGLDRTRLSAGCAAGMDREYVISPLSSNGHSC